MERFGHYVEGKFFAGKAAQANAFAQFRANEYGRNVSVQYVDYAKNVSVIATLSPQAQEQQVA